MTSFSRAGTRPGPGRCLVSVPADGVTPDALLRMSRRQRRSLRTGKLPAKNGRALAKIICTRDAVTPRLCQPAQINPTIFSLFSDLQRLTRRLTCQPERQGGSPLECVSLTWLT